MKNFHLIMLSIACVLFLLPIAESVDFIRNEQFTAEQEITITDELWVSAKSVAIEGTALDDLFILAETLDLTGHFQGSVWGAGEQVNAAGHFQRNTRFAARNAQISGRFDGSLTLAGTAMEIAPACVIAGHLLFFGDHLITRADVGGNLRIAAQKITLGGNIAGDVFVTGKDIIILPGTVIGGGLSYTAPNELILPPSVRVGGRLARIPGPPALRPAVKSNLPLHFLFGGAALLAGLVFASAFPRYTRQSLYLLHTARLHCLMTGFAALFLIPIAIFILLFTLIGLPLSFLLLLFYMILLYLSRIVIGLWIGSLLLRRKEPTKKNMFSTMAAGLLVIYALTSFTAITLFVNLVIILFGLGALILALFRKPVLIIETGTPANPPESGRSL